MNDKLFNYIYDVMCQCLELLDDLSNPDYENLYMKLDSAIDKFYDWYQTAWEHPQKAQELK